MDRKTILAFVLVGVVWIVWLLAFPNQFKSQRTTTTSQKQVQEDQKGTQKTSAPQVSAVQETRNQQEQKIEISTKKYNVELTNRGAAISKLIYKERNVDLVVPSSPFHTNNSLDFAINFNDEEFLQGNSLKDVTWDYSRDRDGGIRFSTTVLINDNPVRIDKIYKFNDESYYFNVVYKIQNSGNESISFNNDSLIVSLGDIIGPSLDFHNTYNQLHSIFYLNGSFEKGSKGGFFSGNEPVKRETGNIGWFGLMSRYFLMIMIPEDFSGTGVIYDGRTEHGFRTGMQMRLNALRPGTDVTRSFRVYVGEKNKERLSAVNQTLIDAADISKWIEPIRYFVLWCLLSINGYIGNIGWSLVIFSILTKIVFTPLTMKSMESMKRMQKLTPKLNELKVKYKDKPDVMQREMMKMYKDHKVNPLGGCFPMLLQMPFFFALYSALINSIDLWNAEFILWIKDLSMPDTIATISGFNINILPLVMTVTSFIQQKMSTVETGPQQKMMMYMMPVILLFIFWSMPSGLVLYWSLQNIFQILNQLVINKFGKKEA